MISVFSQQDEAVGIGCSNSLVGDIFVVHFKKMPHATVVALHEAFWCHFTGVADRITIEFYHIFSRNLDVRAFKITYFESF